MAEIEDDFNYVVYSISYHYWESVVISLSIMVTFSSIALTGMVLFASTRILRPLGGIFLLLFIILIFVQIVRFGIWFYKLSRDFLRRFRPPFTETDFRFYNPMNESTYIYQPTDSAIRLPLGVLMAASVVVAAFQWVLYHNMGSVLDFIFFVRRLIPEESIIAVSRLFGIPFNEFLNSRSDLGATLRTIIGIPSLLILILVMWNSLHIAEIKALRKPRDVMESELLAGRFAINLHDEIKNIATIHYHFFRSLGDVLGNNLRPLSMALGSLIVLYVTTLLLSFLM